MRFKAHIHNPSTIRLVASLSALGPVTWLRLDDAHARFTIIPEQGTQLWAYGTLLSSSFDLTNHFSVLSIDTIFEAYTIQSAANNVINLEVPLPPLLRALRSTYCSNAISIRLTKKENLPLLSLTIRSGSIGPDRDEPGGKSSESVSEVGIVSCATTHDHETTVTHDIPVRVLSEENVRGIHEPLCREPDVHIQLPPLGQLKSVSDRFTHTALSTSFGQQAAGPKLELSGNMHGCLSLCCKTETMRISSMWTGLHNPELDPSQIEGGEDSIQQHPSTRMKELGSADGRSAEGWAKVLIDGRDWSKVMSVGRMGGRVIACICHDLALILYVYIPSDNGDGVETVLTYYIGSYST